MLELFTDLKGLANLDVYGSYKDLERDMYHFNISEVYVYETRYCFILVEGFRVLSYSDVLELSKVDSLEKIMYQSKISRGDYD